jgi:hypothetical protein
VKGNPDSVIHINGFVGAMLGGLLSNRSSAIVRSGLILNFCARGRGEPRHRRITIGVYPGNSR